jgi:predicted transcriptional regulator of viral defense system
MRKPKGVFRPRDLELQGVSRHRVRGMLQREEIERVARGLYRCCEAAPGDDLSLQVAARRVPAGIVCLLSALRHHEIGTQDPPQVWLAIDRKARKPVPGGVPLRIVRFSGRSASVGVVRVRVGDAHVRMTDVPRTIVDCFRYRRKVGIDVAIEALTDALRRRRTTRSDLLRVAGALRAQRVMRPYLEALSG